MSIFLCLCCKIAAITGICSCHGGKYRAPHKTLALANSTLRDSFPIRFAPLPTLKTRDQFLVWRYPSPQASTQKDRDKENYKLSKLVIHTGRNTELFLAIRLSPLAFLVLSILFQSVERLSLHIINFCGVLGLAMSSFLFRALQRSICKRGRRKGE